MVSAEQMRTALRYIEHAAQDGAALKLGGKRARADSGGFYVEPTVFDQVAPEAALAREEVFGPVVALYEFGEIQEAIELANDVDYGLQAGVFTRDLAIAYRIADALNCGGVMINDSSDYRIDAMPFGGTRGSGLGKEGVAHAIHEMTEAKTYCFNL